MTNSDRNDGSDDIQIGNFLAPLFEYRQLIWRVTVLTTLVAAIGGGLFYFLQPVRWSTFLEFRPTFPGAETAEYPNKLPFASTDIIEPTIVDQVYEKNGIQDPCSRDHFRSGLVVDETSSEIQFLDMEYQSRLADTRLSAVDRERLQNEYRARRQALPVQYKLTWLRPTACNNVPAQVAAKALGEILQTWAEDADKKRGVLKLRVAVLTPSVFSEETITDESLLIRADLIRTSLTRVISNIGQVEELPGAELIRVGEDLVSFALVRARLEDLVQVHLDPLVAVAGRGLGPDAVRWVEESLAEATVQQKSAEEKANAYQQALREYSGMTVTPPIAAAQRPINPGDAQAAASQIDRTFIDRIVELSATNTLFRQELTRSMILSKVAAVERASKVEHYRKLLASLKTTSAAPFSAQEVGRKLDAIVKDAKLRVQHFNALYAEFSRVSLRSGPAMYRVVRPPQSQAIKRVSSRSIAMFILAVVLITPVVAAVASLLHHGLMQFIRRRRVA